MASINAKHRIINLGNACKWTGNIKNLDGHLLVCAIRPMPCRFAKVGKVVIFGGDDKGHYLKNTEEHVKFLEKVLKIDE